MAALFDRPAPDYRPALRRAEVVAALRHRDSRDYSSFMLQQAPPTYDAPALFNPAAYDPPDTGPEPLPGQIDLFSAPEEPSRLTESPQDDARDTTPCDPTPEYQRFECPRVYISECPDWPRCTAYPRHTTRELPVHAVPCLDHQKEIQP